MSRKRISRNAPCPCGSGKKYKHCCYGKGFEWQEDEEGGVYKSVPLSHEMADILEEQRQKFIDRYGREPGPNDPVFFDMPPVEQIEFQTVAMSEGNLGCPHEEGEDFPLGGDCPFCPFWKGKQGSNRRG